MKISACVMAASLLTAMTGPSFAEQSNTMPDNSATPVHNTAKKMPGVEAGSVPNSANPGTEAGAGDNQIQAPRTTETKDR